ncbi:hypothetical protein PV328_012035 [Microctonus aethiopoides]|uniref:Uncharacterized protein n=1 Tax=Microctonus aethiopoides TaxID=144406 RepID=A0AA39FH22_9HYME|nr:hypothetical protein PV328_012035 [Microctonus aethiopoides]
MAMEDTVAMVHGELTRRLKRNRGRPTTHLIYTRCDRECPVTVSAALASSSSASASVSILNVNAAAAVAAAAAAAAAAASGENHPLNTPLSNARMAVTSAIVRPPGSPTSSVSPSQSHPTQPPTASTGPPSGRCCDSGRTIFTDPVTGQSICSCQYELLGGYQRLGGITPAALSMYSTPYAAAAAAAVASEGMAAYFPTLGAEQTPFYTSSVSL